MRNKRFGYSMMIAVLCVIGIAFGCCSANRKGSLQTEYERAEIPGIKIDPNIDEQLVVLPKSKTPLTLTVSPRLSKKKLLIEVIVVNTSQRAISVYPIQPWYYSLEFRDLNAKPLHPYVGPPVMRRRLKQSELTLLHPSNAIVAVFEMTKDVALLKQQGASICVVAPVPPDGSGAAEQLLRSNWVQIVW